MEEKKGGERKIRSFEGRAPHNVCMERIGLYCQTTITPHEKKLTSPIRRVVFRSRINFLGRRGAWESAAPGATWQFRTAI